jgi:hypothetical protein
MTARIAFGPKGFSITRGLLLASMTLGTGNGPRVFRANLCYANSSVLAVLFLPAEKGIQCSVNESLAMTPDDLSGLKDDMIAFIEGHGLRRFHGYVDYDEVQAIMWKTEDNTDGWKDFVELAKSSGVPFLTMDSWTLKRDELEELIQRLGNAEYTNDEDLEDARWLRTYVGKTGFVQLGWAYQGSMFLYETSSDWYDRYQRLVELAEDFGGIPIDEPGPDEED